MAVMSITLLILRFPRPLCVELTLVRMPACCLSVVQGVPVGLPAVSHQLLQALRAASSRLPSARYAAPDQNPSSPPPPLLYLHLPRLSTWVSLVEPYGLALAWIRLLTAALGPVLRQVVWPWLWGTTCGPTCPRCWCWSESSSPRPTSTRPHVPAPMLEVETAYPEDILQSA